jgi:hypothetical protein
MHYSLSNHYTRPWFEYIAPPLQGLVKTADALVAAAPQNPPTIDFSFLIFPMAVAYEGFLKQLLFDMKLISKEELYSRKFRIGRALNPDLRHNYRDEQWLYDDLVSYTSPEVARQLWQTWLDCRNHIFHYFPNDYVPLTLSVAVERVEQIATSMDKAAGYVTGS